MLPPQSSLGFKMRSPEGSWGSVASPSLSSSHSPGLCLPQCPAQPRKLTLCIRPPWEGQTSSSNPDSRWMHWASCRSRAHLCPTSPPLSLESRHRWETSAQRGAVICSGPSSQEVAERGLEPRHPASRAHTLHRLLELGTAPGMK